VPAARTRIKDDVVIDKAKLHSARSGKSLSTMVADPFTDMPGDEQETAHSLTPEVRALLGALSNKNLTEEDSRDHVESKHI
jgi:hypothetical protein